MQLINIVIIIIIIIILPINIVVSDRYRLSKLVISQDTTGWRTSWNERNVCERETNGVTERPTKLKWQEKPVTKSTAPENVTCFAAANRQCCFWTTALYAEWQLQ